MSIMDYYKQEVVMEPIRIIDRHIRGAIFPFKPGKITIEIEEHLFRERAVFVFCRNFPNEMAAIRDDECKRLFARQDVFYLANEVGLEAAAYFAGIYIQPEDNIILGGN